MCAIRFAVLVAIGLVTGCALQSPPAQDDILAQALGKPRAVVPPAWQAGAGDGDVADDWLKSFGDPELDAIVTEAIEYNLDLRQAAERVAVAQQAVVVVGSRLLPQVAAAGGVRNTRDWDHSENFNTNLVYASVAWELDVWGKLRAKRAASQAGFEATALDYAYARQSLAATVARTWYLASESRQLLMLAKQAVAIFEQQLDLVKTRRVAGKDSDLDLVDTRARLETAQSELVLAQQSYGEAQRALEVLLGRYPATEIEAKPVFSSLPAPPDTGMPAALLERRPDIVAAERVVLAAFRQKEAAELSLYPDFSISLVGGRLGDNALELLDLNPWLGSATVGAAVPIYEGGALRAQIAIANARQAEAVARYGNVVLRAFEEVENGIANDRLLAKRLPFEESAVRDQTKAVSIATIQYKAGRRDLLWVTTLQSNKIAGEASLIRLQGQQRANRIRLYLALGGGFDAKPAAASMVN